jgi:cyanate permease
MIGNGCFYLKACQLFPSVLLPIFFLAIYPILFSVRFRKRIENVLNRFENLGLDNCEKQLLTNHLREDAGLANSEPASSARLSWRQVRYAFIDWRIYLYVMIAIGDLAVFKCLTTYMPELVKGMTGYKEETHLMTIPLYFVACICCLLAGYSASRRNEHSFHLAFCLSVALVGFILMITLFDRGNVAIYVSTCIACCGTFSAFPLLLSWLTNNVGGHTKRAMAVGFLISIGQIGGILAPQVRLLLLKTCRITYQNFI